MIFVIIITSIAQQRGRYHPCLLRIISIPPKLPAVLIRRRLALSLTPHAWFPTHTERLRLSVLVGIPSSGSSHVALVFITAVTTRSMTSPNSGWSMLPSSSFPVCASNLPGTIDPLQPTMSPRCFQRPRAQLRLNHPCLAHSSLRFDNDPPRPVFFQNQRLHNLQAFFVI